MSCRQLAFLDGSTVVEMVESADSSAGRACETLRRDGDLDGRSVTVYSTRRLAAAVLLVAVEDARSDDPALAAEARRWLAGEGVIWAEMLDISPERVIGWVGRLPVLPYEQLTFFD
jgi:hypothetical protein